MGTPEYSDALGLGRRERSEGPTVFPVAGNELGPLSLSCRWPVMARPPSSAHVLLLPSTLVSPEPR